MVDNEAPEENLPCPTFDYTVRLDVRCVRAFKVLKDKRIATMKSDTSLNIIDTKQKCKVVAQSTPYLKPSPFKEFIKGSLIELENGNLAANFTQNEIVFFSVNNDKIEKIGSFNNDYFLKDVHSYTALSKNRFATIKEKKISIWKGDAPYQNDPVKEIDFGETNVYNMLRLEGTETLIIKLDGVIKLYNMENYSEISSIPIERYGGDAIFQFDDTHVILGQCILDISTKTVKRYHTDYSDHRSSFVNGIKLRNGYIQVDDSCDISDSYKCECYSVDYSKILNPLTGNGKIVKRYGDGLNDWTYIDENTVVGIKLDKMNVFTYKN